MNTLRLGLVSCGFLGCAPIAPGTFGTLGGVAIAWALSTTELFPVWTLVICALLYALGRGLAPWAERHAGRKDPQIFVLDEVIGYLITVLWTSGPSFLTLVVGFFVFRFFDIAKPWPVRRLERIPGGDGILLDDVAAGLIGLLFVMLPLRLLLELPWSVGVH